MADPKCTAHVGERDGYHLVVEFGHYSSDQDAAETEEGLDAHGTLALLSTRREVLACALARHTGTISGLFLGNFAIVSSLTFRCWATIAGGVRVIQSDSETSAK